MQALTVNPATEMPKANGNEPTQETQSKEGPPAEIQIPTRDEVFRDLSKVAKPRKTDPVPEDEEGRAENISRPSSR